MGEIRAAGESAGSPGGFSRLGRQLFAGNAFAAAEFTASRPIAGGAYLTNQQLVAAKAVQRGQSVTLIADAGGMSVRMAGRALSDGLMNQRVRVQNLSSGKIVEGIARSEQIVEIILQ